MKRRAIGFLLAAILGAGFPLSSYADGSNNCLSTVAVQVTGTAIICPNTAQARTTAITGVHYIAVPVPCPPGTSSGSIAPAGGGGWTGGAGGQGQSGGGYLPPSTPTVIEPEQCVTCACGGGSPGSNGGNAGTPPSAGGNNSPNFGPPSQGQCTGSMVLNLDGTYTFSETDLKVPATSFDMSFERTYRSNRVIYDGSWKFAQPEDGPLGYGWSSQYFVKIVNDDFVDSEGRHFHFTRGSDGNYLTDTRDGLTLTRTASGYELKSAAGWTTEFGADGLPTYTTDRTGNSFYMEYSSGKLVSVSDVTGRVALTFAYNAGGRIQSVTDVSGRKVSYEYDAAGDLTGVTDILGNKTTYAYNSYHGLTSKADPLGNTYTIQYDANGKGMVQAILDPAGNKSVFTYDLTNRVLYHTDYDGTTYKLTFNQDGYLTAQERMDANGSVRMKKVQFMPGGIVTTTDEAGNTTTEHWDDWGNVLGRVDGEGNEWKYAYAPGNLLTSRTNPLGVADKWDYDANGRVVKETLAAGTPDETVTTYAYDGFGRLASTTKAGATVSYTYNAAGQPVSVKDALGNVSIMEYDAAGDMTATVDPLGNRTEMTYDAAGDLLTRKDALGNVTTYSYDADWRMSSMTDAKGNATKYEHDFKGRVTKVINALSQGIAMEYDAKGNLVKSTELGQLNADGTDADPTDNLVTTMTYDSEGRRTSVTDANGNTTKYEYDFTNAGCGCSGTSASTPSKVTDPLGNVTVNTFDKDNRVIAVTDPMNYTSLVSYDPAGRVSGRTDANGKTTVYAYDNLGRVVSQTDPAGGITGFTYDALGNLVTVTDAMGNTTKYEYDLAGRKTKETRPMGQYAVFTYDAAGNLKTKTDAKGQVTTYSYDKLNRLVSVAYADGKTEGFTYDERGALVGYTGDASGAMTYDALGRKTGETVNFGAFTKGYSYSYDALGNKASFTGPDGTTYSYGYTKIHQPSTIAWGGYAIAYSYQWDRLTKQALPNGVETDYSYNLNGWLNQISAKASSGTTILDYQYGYENVGNIVSKITESGSYQYGYDDLYRLASAQNPAQNTESFSYDKVGNRLTSADASNWSYNNNNALISYGSVNYSYDLNGNTISKSLAGQTSTFLYNSKDRLEQVNLPDGKIAVYKYDPFNRRISKTVEGVTTYFVYADEGLVAEIDAAGNVLKAYGWVPDGAWGTDPVLMSQGGQTYFYHNNHLGTPQKLTDMSGNVVWSATFTAFGKATIDPASTIINNLRFPGQYYDQETGLHYNWHRYYDPEKGSYISEDPIGLKGGWNLYGYARENPIIYTDLKGLIGGPSEIWGPNGPSPEIRNPKPVILPSGGSCIYGCHPPSPPPSNQTGWNGKEAKCFWKCAFESALDYPMGKLTEEAVKKILKKFGGKIATRLIPYYGEVSILVDLYKFNKCYYKCLNGGCK